MKESGKLYVCEQGNGRVRVVNFRTLFFHASQIVQGDAEESQSEKKDYAVRPGGGGGRGLPYETDGDTRRLA